MTTGAERAGAQPIDGSNVSTLDFPEEPFASSQSEMWSPGSEEAIEGGRPFLAGALVLLALAWTGIVAWVLISERQSFTLAGLVSGVATLSAPLVLIGLVWMLFGRTPRREAERFTRAITAMRQESAALEGLLAVVSARLEDNYARLTGESAKLMTLGDEASDRLGRVTHYLATEAAKLDKRAEALEAAANAAKVDIGVLLDDLPRAEQQARAVSSAMREAGVSAHEQAGALESQLSSLAARGRDADEIVGGAAQRLAAHLARIESTVEAAAGALGGATSSLDRQVDDALARASEALDATRDGLHAQSLATLSMIEKSGAALDKAGSDAARSLSRRIETLAAQLDNLAGQLSQHDERSHALTTRIARELDDIEERFTVLGRNSAGEADRYAEAVASIRASVDALHTELEGGQERADGLIQRSQHLSEALQAVRQDLSVSLPDSLSQVEAQAERTHAAAAALRPEVEAIAASSGAASLQISEIEAVLKRQQDLLNGLTDRLDTVGANMSEFDGNARKIVAETGPELIEALVRVRETANQAASYARETISAVIPESAAALGKAGVEAVRSSVAPHLEEQMRALTAAAERSAEAARLASERLTRQIVTIGETTAAIEARISEARAEQEKHDSDAFARRMTFLIESLNSAAIDVAKILSNEVSDSAWASYLKGDRGVFTRRAVKLLSSGEAREIGRHYEGDPEFREQVNRYVHDFEAMLRRTLAVDEGSVLSVTLLSSDTGKLYVALAQAIERLRT